MGMIRFLLLVISFGCAAEQTIYVFGDSLDDFRQGPLTERAIEGGVVIKHYEPGSRKRQSIENFLSEGLGGNQEQAQEILNQKIKDNQWAIDELMDAVSGEQLVLKHQIKQYPAVLIDGHLFYTNFIDEALRKIND
jgi:hypothetical protein